MTRIASTVVFLALVLALWGRGTWPFSDAFAAEIHTSTELLHPSYKLPARCFAYVGDAADPKTWKLPYLLADGRIDLKRLPAAIEAAITGYRGKKASGIADDALPDVLVRLGRATAQAGKMPFQDEKAAAIYRQLEARLEKLGRMDQIKAEAEIKN